MAVAALADTAATSRVAAFTVFVDMAAAAPVADMAAVMAVINVAAEPIKNI